MIRYFVCVTFFFAPLISIAQERCGTVEYEKLRHLRNPSKETIDQFESWMKGKLAQRFKTLQSQRTASTTYVVPIVVHVIHNGEAVGTGTNISDAQILSQIAVLNNDYERLNADTTKTLSEFKSVAGKFPITFVMAQQDPNGLATTGIVRMQGTQTSWSVSDNYTLKALSYWPAENYLNIWVVNLSGSYIGYTQLPVSTTLQGLESASDDRLTDGVVIDYQAYGTADALGGNNFNLLSEYNKGRTATHEVGHFFGLRHVWGDLYDCTGTDYVSDTPSQDKDFNGTCPGSAQVDCGHDAMFANYMNYTDDACMNIFSQGQADRMDVIINNSPRRLSLLTSPGSQPPAPVPNDIGIKSIVSPSPTVCDGFVTPSLVLRNYGSNDINSTQINFLLNGNSTETKTFSFTLSPNTETTVTFSPIAVVTGSTYNFSFQVMQTNGVADGNTQNNNLFVSTSVPVIATLPIQEQFNSMPSNWTINNPDQLTTWVWDGNSNNNTNGAMMIDFFDYDNTGASDLLITPVIDLTNATIASLSFDYAYAKLSSGESDRLRVLVTTVCDFNSSPTEIFNKAGSALATVTSDSYFIPTSSQWTNSGVISLNQFLGQRIQIAFDGINDFGNNLYLDNVIVLNSEVTAFNLSEIVRPSPVSCQANLAPVIQVNNLGNTVINSFSVDTYLNNQLMTKQFTGLQINPATSQNFELDPLQFGSGSNTLSVVIKSPNGVTTGSQIKDSLNTKRYISTATDIIPLSQNFDASFNSWTTVNPNFGSIWYPAATNKTISMEFDAFTNPNLGDQAWLVSPSLDFSNVMKASIVFESSYGYRASGSERLQVLASTDCGVNFNQILLTSSGSSLANTSSTSSWTPTTKNDWRKNFINLDNLVGNANVRFAFVATNGNGNNLYLDNIDFFVGDDMTSDTLTVNNLYAVYGGVSGTPVKVTFNLSERQNARIQVYGITGNVVYDNTFPDTLNQTYTLMESTKDSPGLFIVRIQTQNPASIRSTKVLFGF